MKNINVIYLKIKARFHHFVTIISCWSALQSIARDTEFYLVSLTIYSGNWYDPLSLTRMWDFRCTISATHVKGTKDDDIQETGEPAERLLDPIFKVGANNKPQCSFKLEVNSLFWLVNNELLSFRHTGRTKCVTGNISDSIMTKKSKAVRKPQNIILDIIRVLYLWPSTKKRYSLAMFVLFCMF